LVAAAATGRHVCARGGGGNGDVAADTVLHRFKDEKEKTKKQKKTYLRHPQRVVSKVVGSTITGDRSSFLRKPEKRGRRWWVPFDGSGVISPGWFPEKRRCRKGMGGGSWKVKGH